ncbi:NUDIX hydrolase [Portibacter lacus]|uniref:NUDIX hydrolase n=1 Tax=Portibacter lacus TaxID=1099794 RepID=A0AA37WDU8_9BACT|nr:NUDIX domain-containing protein [Portibacter lacus]GLR16034.1 NUDIX hydrolase [Portibacter lacus]
MNFESNISLAVDAIVFAYANSKLQVLLIQPKSGPFQNNWALPGGFVKTNEGLKDAVRRELQEETGIQVDYLEQLYTFGDQVDRDPRTRVVSVAYFALVNPKKLVLKADTDAAKAEWFPLDELPQLAYDHNIIIKVAIDRLKSKIQYQPIGFDLLNKEFVFSELEQLYMTILGHDIDRRNFRKKVLGFGILTETGKFRSEGSGRPAKLYRFNVSKYRALESKGFHFEIK